MNRLLGLWCRRFGHKPVLLLSRAEVEGLADGTLAFDAAEPEWVCSRCMADL